jgi:glycogen debranching enzyme
VRYDLVHLRPRAASLFLSEGRTVLATSLDGFVHGLDAHGLFVHETRVLSRYRWCVDGRPPFDVAVSRVEQDSSLGYYTARAARSGGRAGEPRPAEAATETLEVRLSRSVGDGLHEDVDLTNFSRHPAAVQLALDVDADFADADEAQTGDRRQHGTVDRAWLPEGALVFRHRAEHRYAHQGDRGTRTIDRAVRIDVRRATAPPSWEDGRIVFRVRLAPHASWHACVVTSVVIDGRELTPRPGCRAFRRAAPDGARIDAPGVRSLAPVVVDALERARADLAALRLHDVDANGGWVPAAGVPSYVALFGRDVLTAAWQASMLTPAMMHGAAAALARSQATERDDWRDAEPGRMLHEAHDGPLAALWYNPRALYYGSITSPAFYPVVVSELWHWTGDLALARRFVGPALRALRWLDERGDRDGDGFYEYETASEQGIRNQGWKDSGDAIVHADGTIAGTPIATCEVQAYAFVAKRLLSELLWWLGDRDGARRLFDEASELQKRFGDRFWMEDERYWAMGLDGEKRLIRSIGSDPGHCLAAGIVDAERARATADRLLAPDLFSGWGVRTLSCEHPAYDPHSYHRGSVWPVEQATFAFAFARYGLHGHLERLARAVFEAAALFEFRRLPEVFTGHPRDEAHPFPAVYALANSPQAWSASAVVCIVQAILGLYPYAPLRLLIVDPHLPSWLPELTLHELRVGDARSSLRFTRREDGTTDYRVIEQAGTLHVIRQPSPWSLTARFAERMKDALSSLVPG